MDKFAIQEGRYTFPYHYLPHFDSRGVPMRSRSLNWGFEYLCYQEHLALRVRELAPRSLLDVGCGDGRFVGSMAGIPDRLGIDLSEPAIRFARAFHPEVEFICGAASSLSRRFDVVVAVEVLEHVPDEAVPDFINTLAQRTEAAGHVLISVPTVVMPVHSKHYRHYDERLLREQISESGAPLELTKVEYVFGIPRWLDLVLRYSCGQLGVFELPLVNRWIWRYLWKHARLSTAGRGRHLVAIMRRI